MVRAICLRCGAEKEAPWKSCPECRYDPATSEEDLVKSVYLSLGRFQGSAEREQYENELERIAKAIQRGAQPEFDPRELERLREQKAVIESIPPSAVWKTVLRFFLPSVGLLVLLWAFVLLLRTLK